MEDFFYDINPFSPYNKLKNIIKNINNKKELIKIKIIIDDYVKKYIIYNKYVPNSKCCTK